MMISPGACPRDDHAGSGSGGSPSADALAGALGVPESDLRVFGRQPDGAARQLGVALATAPDVATARDRAREVGEPPEYARLTRVSYAGDITPLEAWKLLSDNPDAVLVDVRTDAEWRFVGVPDLSSLGREVVYIEWNTSERAAQRELPRPNCRTRSLRQP